MEGVERLLDSMLCNRHLGATRRTDAQYYGAFLRTKYRTSIHQCFVKLIQILNNINQFRMGYIDFECHTSMLCNKQSLAVLNHSCVTAYNSKRWSIKLKDEEAEIEVTGSRLKE